MKDSASPLPAESFGELLRRRRVDSGLTQEDLAERAAISARTVSDIERGLRSGVYPNTAQRLADALGLDGADRTMFELRARRSPRRAGTQPGDRSERSRVTGEVPSPLTRMIGREAELAAVIGALQSRTARIVTLVGSGGIGKTRLAIEAARRLPMKFTGGVCFVSLAVTGDSRVVPSLMARELGLASVRKPMEEALRDHLRDREMLFVLDTFEHLLPAAAFIAELALACPAVAFLVTSRTPLGVRGEHEILLGPLPVPALDVSAADLDRYDAARLFLERAHAVNRDLVIDARTAATIIEICRRLDGLPLALELAAVRLRHMPLSILQAALSHRLDVLTGGPRDLPPRLQTMRDAIAWSYDLLPPRTQHLLRAVSPFSAGWTMAAAARIADEAGHELLDEMAILVDSSLVSIDEGAGDEPRFRMLDVIREYAAEQAEAQHETDVLARRHAETFADLAEAAEREQGGASQEVWYRRLEVEDDNLRTAIAWAVDRQQAVLAQRLVGALWLYWRRHGDYADARRWLDQALDITASGEAPASRQSAKAHGADAAQRSTRRKALWGNAWISYYQGDYSHVRRIGDELLRLAEEDADRVGIRNGLTIQALVAMAEQRFEDAMGPLEESVKICRQSCRPWLLATSLLVLGQATLHGPDLARSHAVLSEALSVYQGLRDEVFVARTQGYLGYAALLAGDTASAEDLFGRSLTGFARLGERFGVAEEFNAFAALRAAMRLDEQSAELAGAAQALWASMSAQALASDRPLVSGYLDQARRRLGPEAWRTAWQRGHAMEIGAATRRALRGDGHPASGSTRSALASQTWGRRV